MSLCGVHSPGPGTISPNDRTILNEKLHIPGRSHKSSCGSFGTSLDGPGGVNLKKQPKIGSINTVCAGVNNKLRIKTFTTTFLSYQLLLSLQKHPTNKINLWKNLLTTNLRANERILHITDLCSAPLRSKGISSPRHVQRSF